jgi:PAS domain S-box-containing protein
VLPNQGLLSIAFFEAASSIVLLVLFLLFRKDHHSNYFRSWVIGWSVFTVTSISEAALAITPMRGLGVMLVVGHVASSVLFLIAIIQYTAASDRLRWPIFPPLALIFVSVVYLEANGLHVEMVRWGTAILESALLLVAGLMLWRGRASLERYGSGYGSELLAGLLFACGLHGLDRPMWAESPVFLLRMAFDDLLGVAMGIAMIVVVLESGRARTDELNDKMRRLTLLTTASTQSLSVRELLDSVLVQVVGSLSATHGLIRLIEGEGSAAQLVVRTSVGFGESFLKERSQLPLTEPWVAKLFHEGSSEFLRLYPETDRDIWPSVSEPVVQEMVTIVLRGKSGPLGILGVGSAREKRFQSDEIAYLVNIGNLLGLTLQNVRLFEQLTTVQKQWAYTFDSIGDPILVHDGQGRILRANQRLSRLLGREFNAIVGRMVTNLLPRNGVSYDICPFCEGVAGEGDDPDPWLRGYFLASNSTFSDSAGNPLGTVHVLKDITERKRAEEKYRTLVSNVQEGVFISTPQGRFLDFNDALLRMTGYDSREELLNIDIASSLYVNATERDRLKRLLHEHGNVADFEFDMRRKDGEVRSVLESSVAIRDNAGNVTAYQGFVLDISERKRAEHEIRRRNRELLVLNSIGQTLTESMDLTDSLRRTLTQLSELFGLDTSSLFLFDESGTKLRRAAAVGQRSEYARHLPAVEIQPELLEHIKAVHATFLSAHGLALPQIFREALAKEGIVSSYVVVLWSKGRPLGGLVVGSRTPREFSPADVNLLIAVGSQISNATERALLYEESRQAYQNLRRTQEQLLNSEKMAAVGQLISGVAHELNNPLTAILGYSQLLSASGQMGPQGIEYSEKLYKQAQRTHRIVQNLLSFARQHKPERSPTMINHILEDTLALRDYDLRMSNIRVHLNLALDLPVMSADAHQLQQVFLNMVNNAVDAILESSANGDLWVTTRSDKTRIFVEFTDSGPGVQEASRVFDPFYTTKPVGKGTGLGLSICYGIVTEHGGTISVRNLPHRGASFTIELPLDGTPRSQAGNSLTESAERTGLILCIDSDHAVLQTLSGILVGHEFEVHMAKNGDQLNDLIDKYDFDVILADCDLADAHLTTSFFHWIIEHRPAFSQRVIRMYTPGLQNHAAEEDATSCFALRKPLDKGKLLDAINVLLSTRVQPTTVVR